MQGCIAASEVPDFMCPDLFDQELQGHDFSCGVDSFGSDVWSADCFDGGSAGQLDSILADDLALCLVPDITLLGRCDSSGGSVGYESGASDMTMLYSNNKNNSSTQTAGSHSPVFSEDCTSSLATRVITEVLDPEQGSIVACSADAAPKLQLDYSQVLSAWESMGGSLAAVDAGVASQALVMLCLPPSRGERHLLPSYDLAGPGAQLAMPQLLEAGVQHGPQHGRGSGGMAGVSNAGGIGGSGSAMRVTSLQSCALGSLSADDLLFGCCGGLSPRCSGDSDAGSEDSCFATALLDGCCGPLGLMPGIPRRRSGSAAALQPLGAALPQSLAAIPAKTTECARSARAACFVRYKEKKQNRKSGKIRYEMRKINAEKRPRIRGRFVKREELTAASGVLALPVRSASSSESSWLRTPL